MECVISETEDVTDGMVASRDFVSKIDFVSENEFRVSDFEND